MLRCSSRRCGGWCHSRSPQPWEQGLPALSSKPCLGLGAPPTQRESLGTAPMGTDQGSRPTTRAATMAAEEAISWNHRMVWAEETFKAPPVPPPPWARTPTTIPGCSEPIQPGSEPPRDGAPAAALGSLGQGLTTLMGRHFFLTSNLNPPSFGSKPSPLVLSPQAPVKGPPPVSCRSLWVLVLL